MPNPELNSRGLRFSLLHTDGAARRGRIETQHGVIETPVFMPVGTLGSVSGCNGLAIIRIDRAGEAMASGTPLLTGDITVTVALPSWSGLVFPASSDEASA